MEKKCFVALLMVVVMMCACWTGAGAEDERDYQYVLLDDGTIEITNYKGNADRLTIPAKIAGKTVTSIGYYAFYSCDSLTSVSIPDSVEQIGTNLFVGCSKLKIISVSPEHPYFATIDGVLFRKADKALISYPAGIKSSTYTIPQGIAVIGDYAFYSCDSLTSVSIPDSVMQIGVNPFTFCSSLKIISASPEHPYFAVIDGVLFRKADKALISYPVGIKSSTYTIPQGIAAIGDSAFSSCDSLTSVTIPSSVITIGDGAFSSCDSLTSVSIPDSVTSIGDYAFAGCGSLTSVSIPDSVTSIGDYAFAGCGSLTLTVPRNSYAAEYAKANNIPYTYPDANDCLNN